MDLSALILDTDISRIENAPALIGERNCNKIDGRLFAYIELVHRRSGHEAECSKYPVLLAGILPSLGEIVDHLFSRGICRYYSYMPSVQLVRVINNGRQAVA